MSDPLPHPMPDDPQVRAYIERTNAFYPPASYTFTIEENRAWYNRYAQEMREPSPAGVQMQDFTIAADAPTRALAARRYRRDPQTHPGTTLLYLHGGGFILGGLESHADACAGLCAATGIDVVAIAYRLAPEHVHPAQGDDAQAALLYLTGQGQRVVLGGDSAGGNLVAALCLRQKTAADAMPLGQILIYPGLGGDHTKGSYVTNANAPMLSAKEGAYYFAMRSGGLTREQVRDPDLRPLLAPDFSGLPPAFVVTADIDPLRDDGPEYVRRLKAAGVQAQYRNEPELVHGYLRARHMSERAARSFAAICDALVQLAHGTLRSPSGPAGAPIGSA